MYKKYAVLDWCNKVTKHNSYNQNVEKYFTAISA